MNMSLSTMSKADQTPVIKKDEFDTIKTSASQQVGAPSADENASDYLMLPLLDGDHGLPKPPEMRGVGRRQRSASLDNADISYRGNPLDGVDVDDEVYSLPSLDMLDGDDETAGLSLSLGSGPPSNGIPPELLGAMGNPSIEEDTPAAEALRANAEIRVRKVGKLARSVHAQSVRRFVKRATLRGKSGIVRGKPPRIPPPRESDVPAFSAGLDSMFVVEEGDEVEDDQVSSRRSSGASIKSDSSIDHSELVGAVAAGATAMSHEPTRQDSPLNYLRELEKIPSEVAAAGKKVLGVIEEHEGRRKRRKSGRKRERNKSYVKGKVITRRHELYTLSMAVMLGIRTSIGATNSKISDTRSERWLSSEDFMGTEKYVFGPKGGPRTPPHQLSHTFKFKDYSPVAFAYLRRMFGVNEFEFLLSVCGNANFIEFISNAKSGQFFFYSSDGKYMIKTMTNAESKFLRRILPHYFRHCAENPNTLVTKFLGMYRVKMYHLRRNVKFVVMNSVYYTDKPLQSFYDLKGSVLGRKAKPDQDVKKDNDLRSGLPDTAIAMPPAVRSHVRKQIVADCEFMRQMKIMDYSMLIGIHHVPPGATKRPKSAEKGAMGFSLSRSRADSTSFRDSFREMLRNRTAPPSPAPHSMPQPGKAGPSPKAGSSNPSPAHRSAPSPSTPKADLNGHGITDPAKESPVQIFEARSPGGGETMPSVGPDKSDYQGSEIPEEFLYYFSDLRDYEHGFDEDDDSYLEGSDHHMHGGSGSVKMDEITVQKELTIEKIYWPFHRLYDIHGYRRLVPGPCLSCRGQTCACAAAPIEQLSGWKVPSFVRPLSDRKDGGLQADMTGVDVPLTFKAHGQEVEYEGKIFYMGVIDILQQYNVRKRVEARYRRVQGSGWQDASCVHPDLYADRFVRFFDEYSQRQLTTGDDQLDEHEEPGDVDTERDALIGHLKEE